MKGYGQFCPVAKASEVLTERWTPLVVRELLAGSVRFNDLHRGVPLMSRTLLSKRLQELERAGVVERSEKGGNPEYRLTEAGLELRPLVELLGHWGQRWVRSDLSEADLDPTLLMWDIRRGIRRDRLPAARVVIHVAFTDVTRQGARRWWVVLEPDQADLCLTDPGHPVDLTLTTDVKTLTSVWIGDLSLGEAIRSDAVTLDGRRELVRSLPDWFGLSLFADVAPAR